MKKYNKKTKSKKRGFTLVELLAVLGILAIVMSLSVVTFTKVRERSLEKEYSNLVSYIETRAAAYAEETEITIVSVEELIEAGYLSADDQTDIYDPRNGKDSLNCYIVTSSYEDGNYISEFGKDLGRDDNNKCIKHESNYKYKICNYNRANNTCANIDEDAWFNGNITLGVKSFTGNIISNNEAYEKYDFKWQSDKGQTGRTSTIDTIVQLVQSNLYNVRITNGEDTLEASGIVNIDMQRPGVISIDYNKGWTKVDKDVKISLTDYSGSGVYGAYIIDQKTTCSSNPADYQKVENNLFETKLGMKNNVATTYYVCVIDNVGNFTNDDDLEKNKFVIDKIDGGINSISLTPSTTNWAEEVILTGKARDTISGLVAYQFTEGKNEPSNWVKINTTKQEITQTKKVTKNGTYCFWAKDATGNVASECYDVEKVGVKATKTYYLTDGRSSTQSINPTIDGLKTLIDVTTDNGWVHNKTASGSTVSVTVTGGSATTKTETVTKKESATYKGEAKLTTQCPSGWYCPNGGIYENGSCLPAFNWPESGGPTTITRVNPNNYYYDSKNGYWRPNKLIYYNYYFNAKHNNFTCLCDDGKWNCFQVPNASNNMCSKGYDKDTVRSDGAWCNNPSGTCNITYNEKNLTYTCEAKCRWNYGSKPVCRGATKNEYVCSTGTKIGSSCYTCDKGTLNSSTKECSYLDESKYAVYNYKITISYWK